jgi:hypothetical protein
MGRVILVGLSLLLALPLAPPSVGVARDTSGPHGDQGIDPGGCRRFERRRHPRSGRRFACARRRAIRSLRLLTASCGEGQDRPAVISPPTPTALRNPVGRSQQTTTRIPSARHCPLRRPAPRVVRTRAHDLGNRLRRGARLVALAQALRYVRQELPGLSPADLEQILGGTPAALFGF